MSEKKRETSYNDLLNAALNDNQDVANEEFSEENSFDTDLFKTARKYELALFSLLKQRHSVGQAVLAVFWEIYKNGYIQFLGEYNPNEDDFLAWIQDNFQVYEDEYYLNQMVYIVTRIFQPVHQAFLAGMPYTLPSDDSIVTVESLIETSGITGRLRDIQFAFSENEDDKEKQAALLDAALNLPQSKRRTVRNKITGSVPSFKLYYREVMHPETGKFDILLMGLSSEEASFFYSLIGESGEQVFA